MLVVKVIKFVKLPLIRYGHAVQQPQRSFFVHRFSLPCPDFLLRVPPA